MKPKIYIFGPWLEDQGNGTIAPSSDGDLMHRWLSGASIDEIGYWADVPAFERLLRAELAAQQQYREVLLADLSLLRNELIDSANAIIPELGAPISSAAEAYNTGYKMGSHAGLGDIGRRLSNIIDKYHLDKLGEGPEPTNE